MQATEQRLLSFPSGSACSLNEFSFNVFDSFHSGSSRNPSRYEGTRESRLRAASLFSVVRRAKRETRKWPRAWLMARFVRLAASLLPRTCIALTKSEEKVRLLAVYVRSFFLGVGLLEVGSSSGSFGIDGRANMLQLLSNPFLPHCRS